MLQQIQDVTRLLLVITYLNKYSLKKTAKFDILLHFLEYDSVTGIQRDCAEFPEGVKDGECSTGDIAGVNGTVCYCHGENCNNGDVFTSSTETTKTTPPSPSEKQKCLRCIAGENCFTDDSEDGESVECQAPTNTGCYKALVGNIIYIITQYNVILNST